MRLPVIIFSRRITDTAVSHQQHTDVARRLLVPNYIRDMILIKFYTAILTCYMKETLTFYSNAWLLADDHVSVVWKGCATYFLWLFSALEPFHSPRSGWFPRLWGFTLRKAAISGTNDIMEEFRNRKRGYYVPVSTSRLGGEFHRVWAERESLRLNRSANTGVGGATSNVMTPQLTRAVRPPARARAQTHDHKLQTFLV